MSFSKENTGTCLLYTSINACSYAIALAQEKAGSYAEAQAAFAALGEYEDAAAHASECGYRLASELEMSGGAREAEEAFTALGSYKMCIRDRPSTTRRTRRR